MLRYKGWEAEIRPEIGGSLASLTHHGVDVLRPMPRGADDPLQSACFPLVPYCNRIRDGHFRFNGKEVHLPANMPPEPHPLHGLGWRRAWSVAYLSDNECLLQHFHDGSDPWPWSYRAQMRVRVDEGGCFIGLVLANHSDEPMPAGLGLHPYFRRDAQTQVRFNADRVLLVDDELLPTGTTKDADYYGNWSEGAQPPGQLVDHCHTGWSGEVEITDRMGTITVSAVGAPHLHTYMPPDKDFLCCEPVSHVPDAHNSASDTLSVLASGNAAFLSIRIQVS